MNSLRWIVGTISRVLGLLGTLGVAILMFTVVIDVTLRAITGSGIRGSVEYNETLLVIVVFLGLAYAEHTGAHIRTSVVTSRLSTRASYWWRLLGQLAYLIIVVWLCLATAQEAWNSFITGEFRFGLVKVPVWPARAVIMLGFFILVGEVGLRIISTLRGEDTRITSSSDEIVNNRGVE